MHQFIANLSQIYKNYLFLSVMSYINMTDKKRNFQHKYGENLKCPICDVKEDATEHVLSCSKMPPHQLTHDDLYHVKDIVLGRKIIGLCSCNNRLRSDCEVQKSSENSICTCTECSYQ